MKLVGVGYPYRYADAMLLHPDFAQAKGELIDILTKAPVPLLKPESVGDRKKGVKVRKRKARKTDPGDRYFFLPVDQKALNAYLDQEFRLRGWELQPLIVGQQTNGPETGLRGDYKKGSLQVEVQFGNMARWYTDVFKFQLSYSLDRIDVAVLVVPTQSFANLIDENVAYYERVKRELPWAKMSLTLPIWVVGVEPQDYTPIQVCYDRATAVFVRKEAAKGKQIVPIPFEQRIAELPDTDEDY